MLGALLEVGKGPDSAGVRYLHEHGQSDGCDGLGSMVWFSYGADLRASFGSALLGYAVGRAGFAGDAGGLALEAGVGGGTNFHMSRPLGFAGLFWSMYYIDLGGTYAFPIGYSRPDWLGGLQFAVRIHVPVHTTQKRETVSRPR